MTNTLKTAAVLLLAAATCRAQLLNPVPSIASISPTSAMVGGPGFVLTVIGGGFVPSSVVQWGGSARPTTFVDPTQLTADIPSTDLLVRGFVTVTVLSPAPGGGISNAATFTVRLVPQITSLSPSSTPAGGPAVTVAVNGSNFASDSVARWNGSPRPTTYVAPLRVDMVLDAADIASPGRFVVDVDNPAPGGTSNPAGFTVSSPPGTAKMASAYPNPWNASVDGGRPVTFSLPVASDVKIYTLSGRWVKTVPAPNGSGSWDLTNDSGQAVASGVYLFLYTDGYGSRARGLVALVR